MKTFKKILSFFLVFAMLLCFSACEKDKSKRDDDDEDEDELSEINDDFKGVYEGKVDLAEIFRKAYFIQDFDSESMEDLKGEYFVKVFWSFKKTTSELYFEVDKDDFEDFSEDIEANDGIFESVWDYLNNKQTFEYEYNESSLKLYTYKSYYYNIQIDCGKKKFTVLKTDEMKWLEGVTFKKVKNYKLEINIGGKEETKEPAKRPNTDNSQIEQEESPLEFELLPDGTYAVVGKGKFDGVDLVIPAEYKGKPVTVISDDAFNYCNYVKSVVIPDSVTLIKSNAFYRCFSMENLVLSKNLKTIEYNAFYGCNMLTGIVFPESLTYIGDCAFLVCASLAEITFPKNMEYIGQQAFSHCPVKNIILPNGITNVAESMFAYCNFLESVTIPEGVTVIEKNAFAYCSALTTVKLPDSLVRIEESGFMWCERLANIALPENVEYISTHTFTRCGLTQIYIPASVKIIENSAFVACPASDIYCAASSKPDGWSDVWNDGCDAKVHWGNQ